MKTKSKDFWLLIVIPIVLALVSIISFLYIPSVLEPSQVSGTFSIQMVISSIIGIALAVLCYFIPFEKVMKKPVLSYSIVMAVLILTIICDMLFDVLFPIYGVPNIVIFNHAIMLEALFLPLILISMAGVMVKLLDGKRINLLLVLCLVLFSAFVIWYIPGYFAVSIITFVAMLVPVFIINAKNGGSFEIPTVFTITTGLLAFYFTFSERIGYMYDKLSHWLNPIKYSQTGGYIAVRNMQIREGARAFGASSEGIINKSGEILPNPQNEMVFSLVLSSFGWVFAIVLLAVIVFFSIKLIKKAFSLEGELFKKTLAITISFFLVLQYACNILVFFNLIPYFSTRLTFMSLSPSFLFAESFLYGIYLRLCFKEK